MRGRIIYDEVLNYIGSTVQPLCPLLKRIKEQAEAMGVPAACPETLELLKFIASVKKPSEILELGTGNGLSGASMCLALASDDCLRHVSGCRRFQDESAGGSCPLCDADKLRFRLTTVEKNPSNALAASENLRPFSAEIICGDAVDAVNSLAQSGRSFDLVFLDCAKSSYVRLLPGILKLMNPGAVLAADNVLFKGMVSSNDEPPRKYSSIVKNLRAYIDGVMNDERLRSCVLPVGDGVALSVLIR